VLASQPLSNFEEECRLVSKHWEAWVEQWYPSDLKDLDGCIQISRNPRGLRKRIAKELIRVGTTKKEMMDEFVLFNFWFRSFVVLFLNIKNKPHLLLVSFCFCSFGFSYYLVDWFGSLFCFFSFHRFGLLPHSLIFFLFFFFNKF